MAGSSRLRSDPGTLESVLTSLGMEAALRPLLPPVPVGAPDPNDGVPIVWDGAAKQLLLGPAFLGLNALLHPGPTNSDPASAAAAALVVGAAGLTVTLAPLGGGASDIARLEAVKTAVGGRYPIVCQRGVWRDGGGVIDMPTNPWLYQTAWYVDQAAGNDLTGDGSVARPVASYDEVFRRLAKGCPSANTTINQVGNYVGNVICDAALKGEYEGTPSITIAGARTTVSAGLVLAAAVSYAPPGAVGTAVQGYITCLAIPDWTVAAVKDLLIEVTATAGATPIGACGHCAIYIPAHVDRLGLSVLHNPATGQVTTQPAAGDTVRLYSIPKITGRVEHVGRGQLHLQDLEIDNTAAPTTNVLEMCSAATMTLYDCIVRGGFINQRGGYLQLRGCHVKVTTGVQIMEAMLDNWGNWWEDTPVVALQGAGLDSSGYSIWTGASSLSMTMRSAYRMMTFWQWFNTTAAVAVNLDTGAVFDASTAQIWGVSAGTNAFQLENDSKIFDASAYPLAITGATNDIVIGADAYDYADVPITAAPFGAVGRVS